MPGADPLTLMLELSRAEHGDRPFELVFALQSHRLHSAGGALTEATFSWDQLLRTCEELRRLGDTLDSALEVIDDADA